MRGRTRSSGTVVHPAMRPYAVVMLVLGPLLVLGAWWIASAAACGDDPHPFWQVNRQQTGLLGLLAAVSGAATLFYGQVRLRLELETPAGTWAPGRVLPGGMSFFFVVGLAGLAWMAIPLLGGGCETVQPGRWFGVPVLVLGLAVVQARGLAGVGSAV